MDRQTAVEIVSVDEIAALEPAALVARMHHGVEGLDPRVFELDDAALDRAWEPASGVGAWPVRVLLGHLADAELVYAHRIRRTLAEDAPVLEIWDEQAFIDGGIYGGAPGGLRPPVGAHVAVIHTTRMWLAALLFQLDPDQWRRRAMHPEAGPMTTQDLAVYDCWHLEHHAAYLNAKVERLLGPRPAAEACQPGGCGQGCACVDDEAASG